MFSGWAEFLAAFVTFFFSHSILIRPWIKNTIIKLMGAKGFTAFYSLISTTILFWLLFTAGRAPYVEIWSTTSWQLHVPQIAMAFGILLLSVTLGEPNPLSFGGSNNDKFDPSKPGVIGLFRHPVLVVLFVWSFSHIIPNGNLAHIIVFGSFMGFSIIGMKIINRRNERIFGEDEWLRLTRKPVERKLFNWNRDLLLRLAVSVAIYCFILFTHDAVIGILPY